MINDRISLDVKDHIAHVQLSRPEKMNALDPEMFAAIPKLEEALRADKSIRVVVLSGAGDNFCAGLDKSNFRAMLSPKSDETPQTATAGGLSKRTHGIANAPQYAAWMWRKLPMPVIAAIDGVALGGGLQILSLIHI